MDASAATASVIYEKCSPTSFKARSIRHWSDVYLATSELVKYQQGLNTKTKSVITDENVQQKFKTELRALTDESRCPKTFKLMLEERILKTIPNAPKKISLETARRWMIYLGFKCSKQGKGYYTDGHNRPDVYMHNRYNRGLLCWPKNMGVVKRGLLPMLNGNAAINRIRGLLAA